MRDQIIHLVLATVFSAFASTSAQPVTKQMNEEGNIIADIFTDYSPSIKPRYNCTDYVTIYHTIDVNQFLDVDVKTQTVQLSLWVSQNWTDEFLKWDPSKYGNVSRVKVKYDDVWQPLTVVQENIEVDRSQFEGQSYVSLIMNPGVNSSATVAMGFSAIYKVACKLDVGLFPWDTQHCNLFFYSLAYAQGTLRYRKSPVPIGTREYLAHAEFQLVNISSVATEPAYDLADNSWYDGIRYTVVFKRNPLYYLINLLLPCVIINGLCIIGLFTISSSTGERNERFTLGLTGLLSLSVYLLIVTEKIPTTSECVPLLTIFFGMNFLILTFAMLAAVYVTRCAFLAGEDQLFSTLLNKRSAYVQPDVISKQVENRNRKEVMRKKVDNLEKFFLALFFLGLCVATALFIIVGYTIS